MHFQNLINQLKPKLYEVSWKMQKPEETYWSPCGIFQKRFKNMVKKFFFRIFLKMGAARHKSKTDIWML